MVKYCFEIRTYWCHYGAKPIEHMFDTKKKAEQARAETAKGLYDAYTTKVYRRVIITDEDNTKIKARINASIKHDVFDYKRDSEAWGLITFWDGTKDVFYIPVCENKIRLLVGRTFIPFKSLEENLQRRLRIGALKGETFQEKHGGITLKFFKDYLPF